MKNGNARAYAPLVGEDVMRHRIAMVVCFFLFLLFAPPTLMCIHLGMDPDVKYWVGSGCLIALINPILFMALFGGMHARGAKKAVITAAFLLPAVMFAAIGGVYMNSCEMAYAHLISNDCSVPREKAELQMAYDQAQTMYLACLQRMDISPDATEDGRLPPSVASCEEFQRASQANHMFNAEWEYLAHMELNQICGGFCDPGRPLFVRSLDVHEPCAQFVAHKMWTASHQASQVLAYGVIVIGLYIPLYIGILSPALATFGYSNTD